jgi:hypothetical protein
MFLCTSAKASPVSKAVHSNILQNEQCSFTGRNISDYLDETSPSEDSSLIIDMDGEQHKNTGGDNGLEHYVEAVMAEEQSP